jgi:hypothetical protein
MKRDIKNTTQWCILPPHSPDAKVWIQGDHLAAIFEV